MYAEAFRRRRCAADKLEAFASFNGPAFYGLPRNAGTVTLVRERWTLPETLPFGDGVASAAAARRRDPELETGMNNNDKKVMLLIDGDNVSADVVEKALARVDAKHGAVHIRRAYTAPPKRR